MLIHMCADSGQMLIQHTSRLGGYRRCLGGVTSDTWQHLSLAALRSWDRQAAVVDECEERVEVDVVDIVGGAQAGVVRK